MGTTQHGAEHALLNYIKVARVFRMTMSLPKMNLMVTRYGMNDEERASVAVGENWVECVEQFPYRGSLYHPVGEFMLKLNVRLPMLAGPLVHCLQGLQSQHHYQAKGV